MQTNEEVKTVSKKEEKPDLSFPDQKVIDVEMNKEVRKSFIEYSMSVIAQRALPDVRDGMKPGQRRILYAMYEDHLTYDKPFRKSATTVGNVLGRYHPHGDSAVYGTMVRMAQDFSLRYPLIEGHGNFGSIDGDGAAAYRYTEARLAKIADEMMRDIEKEVVDFMPNFDNRLREPKVLPSRFPNLLVNGTVGIAVGMATNIPPHNLGEVVDATIYRMENPDCTVPDLMQYIKGPDFPTKATIYGTKGIVDAYTTGRGHIMVRAKANVEEEHHRIVVTEIPYGVIKSSLCEAIAGLVNEKRIEGITAIRDESGRNGMRIVIEYRRDANGQIILNQLYKYTQLEDTCAVNMLALDHNQPRIFSLPQMLDLYIEHQRGVIERRVRFDLEKAKTRAHIVEGYHIATDNIDRIVEIMKTSPSIAEAKERLMTEEFRISYADGFNEGGKFLSDAQAQAIVEMTLGKLTGMERDKIEDELAKLHATIKELEEVLGDPAKIDGIIKDEMREIVRKFGDRRKTVIEESTADISLEDLIERHEAVITLTEAGYIKRLPADTYDVQKRGGKGIIGMGTKENDVVMRMLSMHSHDYLMLFTNLGRVYVKKAYQIPEASRQAKGTNVVNVCQMQPGEKVTTLLDIPSFDGDDTIVLVTKNGITKRTRVDEFAFQPKAGKRAITLDEGDELLFAAHIVGKADIAIATANGMAVRFDSDNIRCMGRTARGVKGLKLREGDYVVGAALVEEGKTMLTVTEGGIGKRCSFDDLRINKGRGGYGVFCQKVNEKTGKLCGISAVDDTMDLLMIASNALIVRTPICDIPTHFRTAAGVILMQMKRGNKLVGFTTAPHEDPEEIAEDNAEAEAEPLIEAVPVEEAETLTATGDMKPEDEEISDETEAESSENADENGDEEV